MKRLFENEKWPHRPASSSPQVLTGKTLMGPEARIFDISWTFGAPKLRHLLSWLLIQRQRIHPQPWSRLSPDAWTFSLTPWKSATKMKPWRCFGKNWFDFENLESFGRIRGTLRTRRELFQNYHDSCLNLAWLIWQTLHFSRSFFHAAPLSCDAFFLNSLLFFVSDRMKFCGWL